MYYFTADEHYGHDNIRGYCDRPFDSAEEMDKVIIERHNAVVAPNDIVVHARDFTLKKKSRAEEYIKQLNGNHIFLRGSHDRWLANSVPMVYRKRIEDQLVVVCHYAMRVWEESHYGSWQLYGHSHGNLAAVGLQMDVGVDSHDFYPVSFSKVKTILAA